MEVKSSIVPVVRLAAGRRRLQPNFVLIGGEDPAGDDAVEPFLVLVDRSPRQAIARRVDLDPDLPSAPRARVFDPYVAVGFEDLREGREPLGERVIADWPQEARLARGRRSRAPGLGIRPPRRTLRARRIMLG